MPYATPKLLFWAITARRFRTTRYGNQTESGVQRNRFCRHEGEDGGSDSPLTQLGFLGLAGLFRFSYFFLNHFEDTLNSARNTVDPDNHCVAVRRRRNMCVAYLMTGKLQNLQSHIKFWV